jgi:retron-type reverse transcriptase
MLRLIQKWLKAGVLEDGEWTDTTMGTPQGSVISPILANIYLHYVFDPLGGRLAQEVRAGEVVVVRYADDNVLGFQHRADADRFLADFQARLAKFGLVPAPLTKRAGSSSGGLPNTTGASEEGKPETFDFSASRT